MNYTKLLGASMFMAAWSAIACSKSDTPPVTPPVTPPTTTVTKNITLYYTVPTAITGGSFEVIVNTTAGASLLDTIVPVNTMINATVKSDKSLVDLTIVHFFPNIPRYSIWTFKAVDPTGWDTLILEHNYHLPIYSDSLAADTGHVTYVNAPTFTDQPYFNNFGETPQVNTTVAGGVINVDYARYPSNLNYLMLPDRGLYKFSTATKQRDTVDLTTMEQGARSTFVTPPGYKHMFNALIGVMDVSNFNKSLQLSIPNQTIVGADMVYPLTQVKKYWLQAAFNNPATNEFLIHFSYDDSVHLLVDGPTSADYSISSSTPENLAISFSRKPGYYMTNWTTDVVDWYYFASPDSVNLKPRPYLSSLKSKVLGTTDLSRLAIHYLTMARSPQGTNYQQFLDRGFKAAQRNARTNWAAIDYYRNF